MSLLAARRFCRTGLLQGRPGASADQIRPVARGVPAGSCGALGLAVALHERLAPARASNRLTRSRRDRTEVLEFSVHQPSREHQRPCRCRRPTPTRWYGCGCCERSGTSASSRDLPTPLVLSVRWWYPSRCACRRGRSSTASASDPRYLDLVRDHGSGAPSGPNAASRRRRRRSKRRNRLRKGAAAACIGGHEDGHQRASPPTRLPPRENSRQPPTPGPRDFTAGLFDLEIFTLVADSHTKGLPKMGSHYAGERV
jgi:hypothetical protein